MINSPIKSGLDYHPLLRPLLIVAGISVLPAGLILLGFNFGNHQVQLGFTSANEISLDELTEATYHNLVSSFTHTILEWSAFCTAIFTAVLAIVVFFIKRDVTILIIAMALFWAGCMDAFHILAADRLINAAADSRNLSPFTWALSRAFSALIVIGGILITLASSRSRTKGVHSIKLVSIIGLLFGCTAFAAIYYSSIVSELPATMYPDAVITRPWDIIALLLFGVKAVVGWKLYQNVGGAFAAALLLSTIPDLVTQLHMVFGSTDLFDNHFNVAHFIKIISYLVPFVGLTIDYVATYRAKESTVEALMRSQQEIIGLNDELQRNADQINAANKELEAFSYSVSHDLRAPIRHIEGFVDLLSENLGDQPSAKAVRYMKTISKATNEMAHLIDDLLNFARMGRAEMRLQTVDMNRILAESLAGLKQETIGRNIIWKKKRLPEAQADPALLKQVFVNLLSNAIKYSRHRDPAEIEIGVASETEREVVLFIRDNGAGFEMKYADKLFGVFQRLHRADEFEGTGIGLANVHRIIIRHGGRIWADAAVEKGATFYFSLSQTRSAETRNLNPKTQLS